MKHDQSNARCSWPTIAGSLTLALVGAGAVALPASGEAAVRRVIAAAKPCLGLHAEPASDSKPFRCLSPGHPMDLLESHDGWARVKLLDDQKGWVADSLVRSGVGEPAVSASIAPGSDEAVEVEEDPRITKLRASLASALDEQSGLRRGISALRGEIYELLIENEELTGSLAEQEQAVSAAGERIAELEETIAASEARQESATAEIERLVEEIAALEAVAAERSVRLERSEAERRELEEATLALRGEIVELRSANERLASEAAAQPAPDISEANAGLLEEALGLTEAERFELEQAAAALQSEVSELRRANEWLAQAVGERVAGQTAAPSVRLENGASREFTQGVEPPGSSHSVLDETSGEALEATAAIQAWARAWSDQSVDEYLSFYSSAFEPPDGLTREDWKAQRRERLSRPERIDVRLALAGLRWIDDGRLEATFLQSYTSNLMADIVVKRLELVRSEGSWKIVAERVDYAAEG